MPARRKNGLVYQFRITLRHIAPPVWRQIQVPAGYSFWDLHVAIQDAMGWLDYHLHAFDIAPGSERRGKEIGIPSDESVEPEGVLPGWKVKLADVFLQPGQTALYRYDFGDGWEHEILLEGILLGEPAVKYPRCTAGERACPPEDCGGVAGYEHLIEVIRDPKHREHKQMVDWLQGHAKDYTPYDPDAFNPERVGFDSPKKRWKQAFAESLDLA